ncbi:MAG TPA: hypothetical protein VIV12_27140, partial [Streptosporangiaceae bacterium]
MPYASQQQATWAHATGQPFAKRWDKLTDFSKLPKRVRRLAKRRKAVGTTGMAIPPTGPNALFNQPGIESRRSKRLKRRRKEFDGLAKLEAYVSSPAYTPDGADVIAAQIPILPRYKGEQIAPGITRIHGNLCNVHGHYGPCDEALSKKPKGGKGRKPVNPKKTPEQRQAERTAQHAQNRTDTLRKLNIAPDGQQALEALRAGGSADEGAIKRGGFEKAGLVEQGRDGSYRLTGSGRAMLGAADAGDLGRAGATIGSARDRTSARQERVAAREAKRATRAKKKPKVERAQPAGATGAAKPPSPAEQRAEILFQQRQQDRSERIARRAQADTERAARQSLAAQRRADADTRRSAADERRKRADARVAARAESAANRTPRRSKEMQTTKAETYGGVKRSNLDENVFAGPDRSFPIKTAQDVRDAVRSLGRTKHDKAAVKRGIIRRARAIGAVDALPDDWKAEKDVNTFTVFKDAHGADRWLAITTTAYEDRDSEIISTKAIGKAVAIGDTSGQRGPLRYWHVPGMDIGDCDFQAQGGPGGRFLIESGTFRNPAYARLGAAMAVKGYQMSPGFVHPRSQPAG